MLDCLITSCSIIDGSGAPAYYGQVGMENGKLRLFSMQEHPAADEVIDGAGFTAVPGFIDAHSHGDLTMRGAYATRSKISQGITTQIAGQCGVSMFPVGAEHQNLFPRFAAGIAPHPELPENLSTCKSAESFFNWTHSLQNPVHTYSFVGHGTLRLWAMGYENRKPDASELHRMQDMLRQCMQEGALGLSTGLVYAPSCYADNEELLALLEVVAQEGGVYACHPRNEADTVVQARRESIELAGRAGVPLCLSHMKAAGRDNWGKPRQMLADVEEAVARGQRILMDSYPYMAGCTSLNVSIPPQYFSDGMPGLVRALQSPVDRAEIRRQLSTKTAYENYIYNCGGFAGVFISSCPMDHSAEGMFLTEYAEKLGMDPFDAYCEILIRNQGLGLGIYFHMSESDVVDILTHPLCVVGTDGLLGSEQENPHPRTFGTMPCAYNLLVREKKLLTPEQAIRKMSGQTADFLGLIGKGHLQNGYDADLVLLDLPEYRDCATYQQGNIVCSGINKVFSSGKCVYSTHAK